MIKQVGQKEREEMAGGFRFPDLTSRANKNLILYSGKTNYRTADRETAKPAEPREMTVLLV